MANRKKFDLSNPGGQPKDWLQRGAEYDAEFSWWDDVKMVVAPVGIVLGLLACAGLLLYRITQIGG